MRKNPKIDYSKKYIIRYMDRYTTLIGKIVKQTEGRIHYDCIYVLRGDNYWLHQKNIWFSISHKQNKFKYIDAIDVFKEMI